MTGVYERRTFSTNLPMPVCVMDRPPNICAASSAVARPVFVTYLQTEKQNSATVLQEVRERGLLLEESNRSGNILRLLII